MTHLVSDPEKYKELVVGKGLPFYWTVCGSAEPAHALTDNPDLATCSQCLSAIRQIFEQQAQSTEPAPVPEVDESVFIDVDDVFAGFAPGTTPVGSGGQETELQEPESVSEPEPSPQVPDVSAVVATLVGELGPVFPGWRRWLVLPEDDEEGLLSVDGLVADVRQVLSDKQRSFLGSLAGVVDLIGAGDLAAGVVSILHECACQMVRLEHRAQGSEQRVAELGQLVQDSEQSLVGMKKQLKELRGQVGQLKDQVADSSSTRKQLSDDKPLDESLDDVDEITSGDDEE
jgi:uncharacterized coiled-coil protein SlyX